MKIYIILSIIILKKASIFAQNLLKYGSFEQADTTLSNELHTSNKYCKKLGDELKFHLYSNDTNARREMVPSTGVDDWVEFNEFKARDGIRYFQMDLYEKEIYASTYLVIRIPKLVKNKFTFSFFMAFDNNNSRYKVENIDVLVCDSIFFKKNIFCETGFKIILNPTIRISLDSINKEKDWSQIKCDIQKSENDNIIVVGNFNNPKVGKYWYKNKNYKKHTLNYPGQAFYYLDDFVIENNK